MSTSIIHVAATWDVWVAFIWIFLARTYLCTLNSLAAKPGTWARSRSQIRCTVCRSFHGSDKSSFSIVPINGIADAIFGRARCGVFRFGRALLFNAARTVRRWTLNFRATPLMVPNSVLVLPSQSFEEIHSRRPVQSLTIFDYGISSFFLP